LLCKTLEVSESGYYAWCKRPVSELQREDARLSAEVQQIFQDSRQVYGSPRIHRVLKERGISCGRKRIVRLMQALGISGLSQRRRKAKTTTSDPSARFAPNILSRDCTSVTPNTKWVTDSTGIWTDEGWLYLAVVLDVFSRRIVGWAMASAEDAALVELALKMALARRQPPLGLLHHSDRGSEYTSNDYQALLAQEGIQGSMSRTANCWDNAAIESFFATLKKEWTYRKQFQSRIQARQTVFEYIECFYNRVRLHSTLQYVSPDTFEHTFIELMSYPSF
jgi:putative transposase